VIWNILGTVIRDKIMIINVVNTLWEHGIYWLTCKNCVA